MELQIKIIGVLLVLLSFIHAAFPRYFNWVKEFSSVTLINRQMMYVHTFFVALVLLLMGVLCFFSADDLVSSPLGKRISLGICVFWTARLFIQFFGYSSSLWKGKRFETTIHVLFCLLWSYMAIVFGAVYFTGKN